MSVNMRASRQILHQSRHLGIRASGPQPAPPARGWVFFDAECRLCSTSAARLAGLLANHRFALVPLQTPGAAEWVGVSPTELRARVHLLTNDQRRYAGADAFIEIARHILWARPLAAIAASPLLLPWLRRIYDWIAANRYCFGTTCPVPRRHRRWDWLPLLVLPGLAFLFRERMADWVFMWMMALALFAGCKWLTYGRAVAGGVKLGVRGALTYLFGWVGMRPDSFAKRRQNPAPAKAQWIGAVGRLLL